MALADARAICPDLTTRSADPVAQAAGLAGLRRWAGRYSPLVAADGADGLMADITGVAHLFGGESALRDDLGHGLNRMGLAAQTAIAGTRGAAHALARHGGGVLKDADLPAVMGGLSVHALRIDKADAATLNRLGLRRISDLATLPRAALAQRIGPDLLLRLDQILGHQPEPVSPGPAPLHFSARLTLPEAIGRQEDVAAGLLRLLERLCHKLALHHQGARRLCLEMHRVDRESIRIGIGLARPMREPERIAALFAPKIRDVDAGFGIETMRLSVTVAEPLLPQQTGGPNNTEGLADLVSRLGNRIGFDRILRMQPTGSLIPERSFRLVPAADCAPATDWPRQGPPRPVTIFRPEPVGPVTGHPPERFRWRRVWWHKLSATGPERIAPEWWLDDPAWHTGLRDYWRIATKEGPRLWLYHTPQQPGWYAQGIFA